MSKRGVSVFEIVALISLIAAAYFGDVIGSKHSNFVGILCMVAFPITLIFLIEGLAWFERELFLGQKPLPMCRCGKFAVDQMPVEELAEGRLSKCSCGLKYDTSQRGRIILIDKDTESDYALWKPFKGWQVNEKELCRR